jgi:hypothetical protein
MAHDIGQAFLYDPKHLDGDFLFQPIDRILAFQGQF